MNPALSVLLLTTLIGAAQGLVLTLAGVELATRASGVSLPTALLLTGAAVALLLSGAGLVASFFHLGHPERAWRAIAGWRTSWLSREVIVLPAFMGSAALYALARWAGHDAALPLLLLAGLLALVLFVCTGMIYAAVKAIREWASPYTVPNFVLMGLASGLTLSAALAAFTAADWVGPLGRLALAATLGATGLRLTAQRRNQRLVPKSTLQTAIGLRHPHIVQKAQGAMGGSFQTREFSHGQPPVAVRRQAVRAVVAGGLAPSLMLLPVALGAPGLAWVLAAAFGAQLWGLVSERWLFFAQARHPQSLYHPARPRP
ncbi:MAG TPA: dimethyl sulfoxide reductase anchor subunit [Burkholderiaceae bacterium]|nr:dimethyl sulfoxide reductase anchor subunit [Burkholderiaceae bacterium]HNB44828.1 dimethyl sulfoxide reductase anchor subunit [Burkholderiaceae bacterium]HNG81133.1 dimethyl sulfoxide reductase anchor subunit [Burkholderiaceae bacterium]